MKYCPRVRTERYRARLSGDGLLVFDDEGRELALLNSLEAKIWARADGVNSVAAIIAQLTTDGPPSATPPQVWAALDRLGDLGLLDARVAPPGFLPDTSTRRLLTRAIGGGLVGLALTTASGAFLAAAAATAGATQGAHKSAPEIAAGGTSRVEAVAASQKPKHRYKHPLAAEARIKDTVSTVATSKTVVGGTQQGAPPPTHPFTERTRPGQQ